MYIVPIEKDKIETVDGDVYTVTAFNSLFKVNGKPMPAVYILEKRPQEGGIIPFDKIVAIKGHAVEFNSKLNLFESIGPFRRSQQLPQPGDTVIVFPGKNPDPNAIDPGIIVGHIKLSVAGSSPSLRIGFTEKGDESVWYDLSKLLTIKNGAPFNEKKFKKVYSEYFPFNSK
jgi:hypothetical protein